MARRLTYLALGTALVGALLGNAAQAFSNTRNQEKNNHPAGLAGRQVTSSALSVVADAESMETARPFVDKALNGGFETFKLLAGGEWSASVDKRTGRITYAE